MLSSRACDKTLLGFYTYPIVQLSNKELHIYLIIQFYSRNISNSNIKYKMYFFYKMGVAIKSFHVDLNCLSVVEQEQTVVLKLRCVSKMSSLFFLRLASSDKPVNHYFISLNLNNRHCFAHTVPHGFSVLTTEETCLSVPQGKLPSEYVA